MSKRHKIGVFAVATIAVAATLAAGHVYRRHSTRIGNKWEAPAQQLQTATNAPIRNLFLRPETRRVIRSIGRRLDKLGLQNSSLAGTFTFGAQVHAVQVVRLQTLDGEKIEILLDGGTSLTWDSAQGIRANGTSTSGAERDLVERLVFDSPDQFVLAQLRGASYYMVARHLRPTGAPDGYSGPLWDVVRVADPADSRGKDRSGWRLYYVNEKSGLIDQIRSEVAGQAVTATLTWSKQADENFPSKISWTREGQPFMEFNVSSFSVNPQ